MKAISLAAEPNGPAKPQALEAPPLVAAKALSTKPLSTKPLSPKPLSPKPHACVVDASRFVNEEARAHSAKEAPPAIPVLPLGSKLHIQESLNRLDTRLCFALAREDLELKAQLLKRRRDIEAKCNGMDMDSGMPDKLLPTPALQSKKHAVELEMAKRQLQLNGKPTPTQVELKEALERELCRRIPGRQAEQAKDKSFLRELSNSQFLKAYNVCAQQLYLKASIAETPYDNLVFSWGKWQAHTQEAAARFGEAWLWQYV